MLQATLKVFFSAATPGWLTSHSRQLSATAVRRKCNHIETLLARKYPYLPPGLLSRRVSGRVTVGLPLSDQTLTHPLKQGASRNPRRTVCTYDAKRMPPPL